MPRRELRPSTTQALLVAADEERISRIDERHGCVLAANGIAFVWPENKIQFLGPGQKPTPTRKPVVIFGYSDEEG